MPRTARLLPEEGIFHIITRGNNRQRVFHEPGDFEAYLGILHWIQKRHLFRLYHYCLMPNHVHLLLECHSGVSLSVIMKKLNLTYALHYKNKYQHVGHFWQDRFKSLLIERDTYLLACGAYIELNPVKAGLVNHPEEYPYSSYRFYAFGEPSHWISPDPLYEGFGDTPERRKESYREFVLARLEAYEQFEKDFEGKPALGSDHFLASLERQLGLLLSSKARGRPKRKRTESVLEHE